MKKTFLIACTALLVSLGSCAQKKNGHALAVAFYNCENLFDTQHDPGKNDEEFTPEGKYHYTENIYHKKLHNIATAIQQLGTDEVAEGPAIIGLAEIENGHVLNDLISQPEIADRHYQYAWFDGPDERGIDVAMLYNPRYFKLIKATPLHVDLSGMGDKETTRDVLHVQGVMGGDTVDVFVNHWPSRRGEEGESDAKRATAAKVDRDAIDAIMKYKPNAKVIVMGDLNDNPTDISVTQALGAKGDKNIGMNELYDPMAELYNNGQGTLAYKHHWDLFDQIIFSGAFLKHVGKLQFGHAEIFNKDFLVDHYKHFEWQPHRSFAGMRWINGYSDHFPVVVYLSK